MHTVNSGTLMERCQFGRRSHRQGGVDLEALRLWNYNGGSGRRDFVYFLFQQIDSFMESSILEQSSITYLFKTCAWCIIYVWNKHIYMSRDSADGIATG
jgi:hypothetical protein